MCVCVWVLGTTSPGARLSLNAALLISASGTYTHTHTQSRISLSATSNSFYLVFSTTTTTTMLLAVLVMYPIGYSFPDHLIIKSSWMDTLWNVILTTSDVHKNTPTTHQTKCALPRCTVEDGTGQALIFLSGDCCRSWLKLPANIWKILQENVLPHEGEFVYLSTVFNFISY